MTTPARSPQEIIEPVTGRTLGEVGFLAPEAPASTLLLPVDNWPGRDALVAEMKSVTGRGDVAVRVMNDEERLGLRNVLRSAMNDETGQPKFLAKTSRTRVLGISSGKGGVGKSSVSVNLAVALAEAGHSVGLMDADVYGSSIPKMLGASYDPVVLGDTVLPTRASGVRALSMGYFVDDDQPVIWRGPMLHKAIEQLLREAFWDEPDFLLIDMPPGTGDVALTLSELLPRIEMFVVTTPQPAAQRVAQRSAYAARKLKLAVRGVIENMSWFVGDDGTRYELFGRGGGSALAAQLGTTLLGQIPLEPALREGGDVGRPVVLTAPDSPAAIAFREIATKIAKLGAARVYRQELTIS